MKSKRQSSPSQQTKEESGVYTLSLHNSPCKFRAAYILNVIIKKRLQLNCHGLNNNILPLCDCY